VFGEIIPQAVFSRYAIALGSATAWIVKIFLVLLWPVAAPLAWVLDKLLGEELPTRYSRKELVGILREHGGETIESHEERIARGALTFSGKRVREVMTPRSMVHAVEQHDRLTADTVKRLHDTGFSRFPVYDTSLDRVVGVLYAQQLLGRASHNKEAIEVCDRRVRFVPDDAHLDQTLNSFIKSKRHLFMVLGTDGKFSGIISIEDVIEEILGVEIVDEFDKYEDLRSAVEEVRRSHVTNAESEN
jgi:metal transporter CNNM